MRTEGIIVVNQQKLALLFALQEQPTAPAVQLANEVGVTPPTARSWLRELEADKVYSGVQANLRIKKLGLEMDDFLVLVSSYDALQKIEKFCYYHPYTSYRARIFGGKTQGIILQFRQPDAARQHLEDSFEIMKKRGIITELRELPTLVSTYGSIYTSPKLEAWDPDSLSWSFDWENWWEKAPENPEYEKHSENEEKDIIKVDFRDVQLIEQLTMNARRKNVDLIRSINLNPDEKGVQQEISGRLSRINEALVESYRVYINWNHFDIYNTPFVIAKTRSENSRRLISHLKHSRFPFSSSIRETPDGFVWSARLPSAHLSELVSLIWRITDSYEILNIDYKHSMWYGLWAGAFDGEELRWKTEREFCLEKPLESIGL